MTLQKMKNDGVINMVLQQGIFITTIFHTCRNKNNRIGIYAMESLFNITLYINISVN